MPLNLVLIGPPGSGKGTQAKLICDRFGVPMISTGDILRAAVKARSPLGRKVGTILASGGLVNDEMMIALVQDRLAEPDTANGFILDGFPRTAVQADALDTMLNGRPLRALALLVPDAELERRLFARRICSQCKTLYSTGRGYGSEAELCSKCGAILIRRDDDNLETIRRRLKIYRETAEMLIAHYQTRRVLESVDGSQPADEVTAAIMKILEGGTS
jgi:adenylate kinase